LQNRGYCGKNKGISSIIGNSESGTWDGLNKEGTEAINEIGQEIE